MKSFFKKNKKKTLAIMFFVFLGLFVFLFPNISYAGGEGVAKVLGWIMYPFIWLMGKLVSLFIGILVQVAQYDNFIKSSAVTFGWRVVRDLCNMFFVLILLVIAFATILRIESYNLKTWLPKLVIMAILINFSKLICGVFIDFAQVFMLTFVNAFKDIAGANLIDMLGIDKILAFGDSPENEVSPGTILGSMILGLIMVIIAAVVILTMLIMLVIRIVMIWIYVVLSPLAYLLASFPQGKSYSERWWSDFSKNLIIGPILAFFIWLSFASLGGVAGSSEVETLKKQRAFNEELGLQDAGTPSAAITEAGSEDNMIKFIISIAMLLGGLMIAQEMGGMAGKVAGGGMAKLQAMGSGALKVGKRVTGVQRVQDAYKARQSMKEAKRIERAQGDAQWATEKIGKAKEFAGNQLMKPLSKTGDFVKERFGVGKNSIKEAEAKVEQGKSDIENVTKFDLEGEIKLVNELENKRQDINNEQMLKLNNAAPADHDKINEEYKEKRENLDAQITEKNDNIKSKYEMVTGEKVNKVDDIKQDKIDKYKADKNAFVDSKNSQIEKDELDLNKKRQKAEKIGKYSGAIGGVVGAIGGFALGGPVGAAIVTSALAAGFGRKKIKHAGEKDLDMASNYNSGQINKYKEKMKDDDDDVLKKKMNDYSLDRHERTAATMTLMEKGKLSNSEAKVKKDEIMGKYSYDNKVMNQLDSSLASNYQNLTQSFTTLHQTSKPPVNEDGSVKNESNEEKKEREEKHEKAKEKIVRGIIGGTIKIENINDQKSLDMIMPKAAEIMSSSNLSNILKGQTSEKQKMSQDSLKRAANDKSLSKSSRDSAAKVIIGMKNDLSVVSEVSQKEEYLEKADKGQIKDIMSSLDGINSFIDFLDKKGKRDEVLAAIRSNDDNAIRSVINSFTKKAQLVDSSADNAVIKALKSGLATQRPSFNPSS